MTPETPEDQAPTQRLPETPPQLSGQPPFPGHALPAGQPQVSDLPDPGQANPGQPYPGQPYPGQPYPGQAYPGQPYPGQPYPGQPYPGQPYPAQAPRTSITAVLALVFGIFGGLLGIVFGHIALAGIKRTGERGRGMAIAGLVLGYLTLATSLGIGIGAIALAVTAANTSSSVIAEDDFGADVAEEGPAVPAPSAEPTAQPTPQASHATSPYCPGDSWLRANGESDSFLVFICEHPGGGTVYVGVGRETGNSITLPAQASGSGWTAVNDGAEPVHYTAGADRLLVTSGGGTIVDEPMRNWRDF